MHSFSVTPYNLPRLNHREKANLHEQINRKKIETVIKKFQKTKSSKESACTKGDLGSIPGEGKGYLLQYSGLENSMGLQRVDSLEKTLMLGGIGGRRRRATP